VEEVVAEAALVVVDLVGTEVVAVVDLVVAHLGVSTRSVVAARLLLLLLLLAILSTVSFARLGTNLVVERVVVLNFLSATCRTKRAGRISRITFVSVVKSSMSMSWKVLVVARREWVPFA
jgi:hypothetical protein